MTNSVATRQDVSRAYQRASGADLANEGWPERQDNWPLAVARRTPPASLKRKLRGPEQALARLKKMIVTEPSTILSQLRVVPPSQWLATIGVNMLLILD